MVVFFSAACLSEPVARRTSTERTWPLQQLVMLWTVTFVLYLRRRSSVNFGEQDILPENYVWKTNNVSEFYVIFAWKNDIILHDNCTKNIFPIFFLGGGSRAPCPLSTTPMVPGVRDEVFSRHQISKASRRFAWVLERPCLASVQEQDRKDTEIK